MIEITKSTARVFSRLGQAGALFGIGLIEKAEERDDIVVLSADMAKPAGLSKFSTSYPKAFFNVGIAEQNLVGVAAGISNEGYKVISSAQACFLSMRSYEQLRQYSGYMNLPLIYVGVSSGFALTFFGNTHYALEDLTLLRSIPGMTVISPSDPGQAIKAIEAAIDFGQPVYIRCTGVPGLPPIYNEDFKFQIGKGITLNEGKDVVLIASGSIMRNVIDAAALMSESLGLSFKIIDMHTVSPVDEDLLSECMSSKLWVTIEEHFVSGGLGSVVSEFLSCRFSHEKPHLMRIGVKNRFSTPGDYQYLLEANELDTKGIVKQVSAAIYQVFSV